MKCNKNFKLEERFKDVKVDDSASDSGISELYQEIDEAEWYTRPKKKCNCSACKFLRGE